MSGAPSFDSTYGALFLGLLISAVVYGVSMLQAFLYFKTYRKDSMLLKSLVAFLVSLDTLHLILITVTMYNYLIYNFNNPIALATASWSMLIQADVNGVIGMLVQFYFARRVFILSKNTWLTGAIVLLAVIHFSFGIYFTVEGFTLKEFQKFGTLVWATSIGLGSAAAADIVIAASMCFYLSKNRTGFSKTDSLINMLIAYSLATGLVTGIIALLCVVTFATMPNNDVWFACFWVIGRFYVSSILASLNSRESLREHSSEGRRTQDGTFLHLTPLKMGGQVRSSEQTGSGEKEKKSGKYEEDLHKDHPSLAVNVQTQTVSKTDHYEYIVTPARNYNGAQV